MNISGNKVTWRSSGREEEVIYGIVGLGGQGMLENGSWELMDVNRNLIPNEGNPPLTSTERQELADYMINQWTRFRNGEPSIEFMLEIMKGKQNADMASLPVLQESDSKV